MLRRNLNVAVIILSLVIMDSIHALKLSRCKVALAAEEALNFAKTTEAASSRIAEHRRLSQLSTADLEKERRHLLFDESTKATQNVFAFRNGDEIENLDAYFRDQSDSPLKMLNHFRIKELNEWIQKNRYRRKLQTHIGSLADSTIEVLEFDLDYVSQVQNRLAGQTFPSNYRFQLPQLKSTQNHTHSVKSFLNLASELKSKLAQTALTLVKPKTQETSLSYLRRAYQALNKRSKNAMGLKESEFYAEVMLQQPQLFEHMLLDLKAMHPKLATDIELAVYSNSHDELLKTIEKVKAAAPAAKPGTLQAPEKSYYDQIAEEQLERDAKFNRWVGRLAVIAVSAISGGLLSDDENELAEMAELRDLAKKDASDLSQSLSVEQNKVSKLNKQLSQLSTASVGKDEHIQKLTQDAKNLEEVTKTKQHKINELEKLTQELQKEVEKLNHATPEQQKLLNYINSLQTPSTEEGAEFLINYFNQALPREKQKTAAEWKTKFSALAAKATQKLSLKQAFEEQVLKSSGQNEIIYNKEATNPLSFIENAKGQCFSMTNAFMLSQLLSKSQNFKNQNPVYVELEGHVLSGLMIPALNAQGKKDFKLLGYEHTAAGIAEIDFGFTSELHKQNKGIRILEPQNYAAVISGRSIANDKQLKKYLDSSLQKSATKFGHNLSELEKHVANSKTKYTDDEAGLNSSVSSFGDSEVEPGDHKRKELSKISFGNADPNAEFSLESVLNGGATRAPSLTITNTLASDEFRIAREKWINEYYKAKLSDDTLAALGNNFKEHSRMWKSMPDNERKDQSLKELPRSLQTAHDYAIGLALRHLVTEDKDQSWREISEILNQAERTTSKNKAQHLKNELIGAALLLKDLRSGDESLYNYYDNDLLKRLTPGLPTTE